MSVVHPKLLSIKLYYPSFIYTTPKSRTDQNPTREKIRTIEFRCFQLSSACSETINHYASYGGLRWRLTGQRDVVGNEIYEGVKRTKAVGGSGSGMEQWTDNRK